MRPLPVLLAILMAALIYAFVFQREAALEALSGEAPAAEETVAQTEPADMAEAESTEKTPVGVVAVHSTARVIDSAVILRGETAAVRMVNVLAETSGRVVSDPLRAGATVTEGQTLCALDKGTREASVKQAQAALATAQIELTQAERLQQDGFASETRLVAARAGLEQAQAALEQAQRELENIVITAPFAGLLNEDSAELGALLQPGSLCATVLQLDPMKLVGYVPETEVSRVNIGAMAGARLANGMEVQGKVTFLSRASDPSTRTFKVDIEVPNPDLAIRDGQTAEILIASDGADAHLLPQSALTLDDEGTLGVRLVGAGNMAEFAPVKLLRDTVNGVWVTGLPETADVIIIGQEYVVTGVPVKPEFRELSQ